MLPSLKLVKDLGSDYVPNTSLQIRHTQAKTEYYFVVTRERVSEKAHQRRAMRAVEQALAQAQPGYSSNMVYVVQLWRGSWQATLMGAFLTWLAATRAAQVPFLRISSQISSPAWRPSFPCMERICRVDDASWSLQVDKANTHRAVDHHCCRLTECAWATWLMVVEQTCKSRAQGAVVSLAARTSRVTCHAPYNNNIVVDANADHLHYCNSARNVCQTRTLSVM